MGGIGVLPSALVTIEPDGGRYGATKGAATTLMVLGNYGLRVAVFGGARTRAAHAAARSESG